MEKERELLLKLRGHLAYAKNVAPYVIFKDTELEDLLEVKPKSLGELSTIKGFPADGARVTKWGEAIVSIFKNADSIDDFEVEVSENSEPKVAVKCKRLSLF